MATAVSDVRLPGWPPRARAARRASPPRSLRDCCLQGGLAGGALGRQAAAAPSCPASRPPPPPLAPPRVLTIRPSPLPLAPPPHAARPSCLGAAGPRRSRTPARGTLPPPRARPSPPRLPQPRGLPPPTRVSSSFVGESASRPGARFFCQQESAHFHGHRRKRVRAVIGCGLPLARWRPSHLSIWFCNWRRMRRGGGAHAHGLNQF